MTFNKDLNRTFTNSLSINARKTVNVENNVGLYNEIIKESDNESYNENESRPSVVQSRPSVVTDENSHPKVTKTV